MKTSEHIDKVTSQIRSATDCQVLAGLIHENADSVRAATAAAAVEMAAIAKNFMPIIKPPGARPNRIVKWVKKLIGGTIMPKVRAYAKLAIELAETASAASRLAAEVAAAQHRLSKCDEIAYTQIMLEIETTRQMVEAPLNTTLIQLERAQNDLQTVIDTTLDATFDISSVENFLASASDVLPAIESQVDAFTADETPAVADALGAYNEDSGATGTWVDTALQEVRYEDGVAIEARDRTSGFTGTVEVITGVSVSVVNVGTEEEPVWESNVTTTTTALTFNKGILV